MLWVILGLAALTVFSLGFWTIKPIVSRPNSDLPADFPSETFDHSSFESLLKKYAGQDGGVDYESWHQRTEDRERLRRYLAAVARFSPENAPERFQSKEDRVAYWMYAYNAMVVDAILERWPLKSVLEVKAPIEVVKGLGFFYKLKFTAGERTMSLYEIEHDRVIALAEDPRVHFVLNCGSGGCPVMRPELPTGKDLEPFLRKSAADFVSQEENVSIDHQARTVTVSKIFDWYEEDFYNDLRRRGVSTKEGILAYLPLVAEGNKRKELMRAKDYRLVVRPYDWSVNSSPKGHP